MPSPSDIKGPPTADIAEQAIIATIFHDPEYLRRLRARGVTSESFYTHRSLFKAVASFIEDNGSIEAVAFTQHLQTIGEFDALGGTLMMETLLSPAHQPKAGWSLWLDQLQEAYSLRIAYIQAHKGTDGYEDSEEAQSALKDALDAISVAKSGPRRSADAKEATAAFVRQFIEDREAGAIPGTPTGLAALDAVSGGMRAGELWVVGGQTSRGKSVLMTQIASEVISSKGRVAVFSLEMSVRDVTGRLATVFGDLDFNHITKPGEVITKGELIRIQSTLANLQELDFRIDDSSSQTIDHIATECGIIRDTEGPLGLIVVDYIQLVEGDRKRGESREQEVARISRGLKQLAKEHRCPVITATQLNEEGKTRESRAIAQDADALLFIADDGVKIGKLRNGPRGGVLPLFLDGRRQRFTPVQQPQ
ncbi:MAG: AAA family ATPase [Akkermansiaceae bacterium]|nr:AAA family ATPase [Akkermansiaceae bacterium]